MTTFTVKQSISLNSIQDLFKAYGRGDQFSYEALQAIMEYLEETSENEVIDLDIIAICCSFTESLPRQIIWDLGLDESDFNYDDELDSTELLGYLEECTRAIELNNGNILYINY